MLLNLGRTIFTITFLTRKINEMKHSIISNQKIDSHNSMVNVQLNPDTELEKVALANVANISANDNERELIENYLHFGLGLGNYSVVKLIEQQGNIVTLQIFV